MHGIQRDTVYRDTVYREITVFSLFCVVWFQYYVKIFTKEGSGKSGLCGKENHTKDDFDGAKNNTRKGPLTDCAESQPEGCEELLKIWR